MVDGEPLPRPAEPRHHLVRDHHDAEPVAEFTHTGQVPRRWDHDPRGSGHRFEDDRGDGRRTLHGDDGLEVFECALALLLLVDRVELRAVQERAEEMDHPRGAVIVWPASWVAGHVDRCIGATVIGAEAGQHLAPSGVQSRHPHRMFDGIRAAVGEEDAVEVTGGAFGDQACSFGPCHVDVLRCDGAERSRLFGDGLDHFRMLVSHIGVHHLRREVQQPIAVTVPDV